MPGAKPWLGFYELPKARVGKITRSPADDFAPSWSPDSRRIAFESDRDGSVQIYAVNADGGAVRRLTEGQADKNVPQWQPARGR